MLRALRHFIGIVLLSLELGTEASLAKESDLKFWVLGICVIYQVLKFDKRSWTLAR